MKIKLLCLYALFLLFFTAGVCSFADESGSSSNYQSDINKLIAASSENIKEVNEDIDAKAIAKRNQTREEKAREYYQKGVDLANAGKLDEAREYFEKAISLTNHPEMAGYKEPVVKTKAQPEVAKITLVKEKTVLRPQADDKERRDQINKQAERLYSQAVDFFKDNKYSEAKTKFEELSLVIPDYKATKKYLVRIDKAIFEDQQRIIKEHQREAESQRQAQAEIQRQEKLAQERKHSQEIKDKMDQTQKLYAQAQSFYRDHQWEQAKAQFESVEQMSPNFKHTHRYLGKIDALIVKVAKVKPELVAVPAPSEVQAPAAAITPSVEAPVSIEGQQKQAQDISALAEKSAQLYHQIADIADDKSTVQTKKKMAQVDEVLRNLKENKERLVRQMQEEESKRKLEESKAKQKEQRDEAERLYQDAQGYLRANDYVNAKVRFLALENIIPDYKATRRYLKSIEEEQKKESAKTIIANGQKEADYLKQIQDKENTEMVNRIEKQNEDRVRLGQIQQEALKELTQKASDINDDIIRLSKDQNYEVMKAKFAELESTVSALAALKDTMAQEKERSSRKELFLSPVGGSNIALPVERFEGKRPIFKPSSADIYKRREVVQEQNTLFREAVDRYEHQKYTQAKLLFGELANMHDHRAYGWLKKVDRAITGELLRSQAGEERERTAFIADQLKAQRQLLIIQERERQRQKTLTDELERQKRLYEDDRLFQLRKQEMMKAQEHERQRQELRRLKLQKESEKQQEMLRFHKIAITVKPQPKINPLQVKPVVSTPTVVPVVKLVAKPVVEPVVEPIVAPVLTFRQIQAQRIEQVRQAKLKAVAEIRERIKEEKQRQKERQEELRAAKENARIERIAQEKKRREDLLRQEEQQREVRIKQEQIIREQAQRRQELAREDQQRQFELAAQRDAVRKQLENGVEAMYQEAMRLYSQGNYSAAADKFKDVQDILPDYKHAGQYMDESRLKSLTVKPQTAVPSVSRQESVSRALDLFDTNAK